MDLRPRPRHIQTVAAPIVLILLDSSTVYRASAKDTIHHREINVVHLLVVRQQETKTQQSQLDRAIASFILPVIHRFLWSSFG